MNKEIVCFARKVWMSLAVGAVLLAGSVWFMPNVYADTQIQLHIDGKIINAVPAPIIVNDRMLVPLRIVSEELGAVVTWNEAERSVLIEKGNRSILLRIDRSLISYTVEGYKYFQLSDVMPQIHSDRTFVPIRLISNALGVGIEWEEASRTVKVDSSEASSITPFFDMRLTSVKPNATIAGTTTLQSFVPATTPAGASEIRYLLISPDSGMGVVIARGNEHSGAYQWVPSMRDNGEKVLVAALYDSAGKFIAGDAMPIVVGLVPKVELTGVVSGQTVSDTVKLSANLNFSAAYVTYEIVNTSNGKVLTTGEQDPLGTYSWTPTMPYNGDATIKVTAFDQKRQAYSSQSVNVRIEMERKFALGGVKAGQSINNSVTLYASRNFDVIETEYLIRDLKTGSVGTLAKVQYVSYSWFPGPGSAGDKELFVRVKATDGTVYTSDPIAVNVTGAPKLLLKGAGPNQVITSAAAVKLYVTGNVALSRVQYVMTNSVTGVQKIIATYEDASQTFAYTPLKGEDGTYKLKAIGTYGSGQTLSSEEVAVKVYTGTLYGPKPVIEKSEFLSLASKLALADAKRSGMSAALQTAQAILETGWGQSVPVDKYSGQMSFNLFGIKGTAVAGSVVSNTWEEYNGVAYRTDAKFRAYHDVEESWIDHNKLLLTGTRYIPFTKVMYDSGLGAWALKRAGYATDSKYPLKLMDIIETYHLEVLDQTGI